MTSSRSHCLVPAEPEQILYHCFHRPSITNHDKETDFVQLVECSFKSVSVQLHPYTGGGRQQPVAMGGRNVGNDRVREGMIVSPRPSLSPALPRSLSWWPRSPTQRRAVSPTKQTTSVAKSRQNVASPPPPNTHTNPPRVGRAHVLASSSKNKCEGWRQRRGIKR